MTHEKAEDFLIADALGDGRLEVLHHTVEEVGCFFVDDIRNLI